MFLSANTQPDGWLLISVTTAAYKLSVVPLHVSKPEISELQRQKY